MRAQLWDHNGEWCAWCLTYFDRDARGPDSIEGNHMLPQSWFRTRFPERVGGRQYGHYPFEWVVRAHRRCHRPPRPWPALQLPSNALEWELTSLDPFDPRPYPRFAPRPGPDKSYNLQALDEAARLAHEAGLYPVAMVLKWFLSDVMGALGHRDGELALLRLEVASLAGVRHNWRLKLDEPTLRQGGPALAYHYANYLSDRGDLKRAAHTLGLADELLRSLPASHRGAYETDRALRHAQIDRARGEVVRALQATAGADPYRHDTATVIAVSVDLQRSEGLTAVRDRADALLSSAQRSWLYRAEAWFARGCARLAMHNLSESEIELAYMDLASAQYTYVLLRLQGPPHGGVPTDRRQLERADVLPVDVLLTSPALSRISRGRALELRRQALLAHRPDSLQDQLLRTLTRWRNPLQAPPPLTIPPQRLPS